MPRWKSTNSVSGRLNKGVRNEITHASDMVTVGLCSRNILLDRAGMPMLFAYSAH